MHEEGRPVMLRKISDRQRISKKYLDNIFSSLRVAGLLRTVRGASGGYLLAKPASEIQLSEVVSALEGSMAPVDCTQNEDLCPRSVDCAARELWIGLEEAIANVLEGRSLADLVRRQNQLDKG
jgi:Rrf2 family protein